MPLGKEQVRLVRRISRDKIAVQPSVIDSEPDTYDITASSWIGTIVVEGLQLVVTPKIPVDRVLFLVAYAVDPVNWKHMIRPHLGSARSLVETVVPAYVAQLRRAVAAGVLQGYSTVEDSLLTVRGRIRMSDQIRHRYGRIPPIEVSYDEFSEDILLNRILRAAVRRLLALNLRSEESVRSLREFDVLFGKVSIVEFNPQGLPEIAYDRLTERYRPAIELAKMVLADTSIELSGTDQRASGFLVNMNDVFEDFAWIALREALGLSARAFPQGARQRDFFLDSDGKVSLEPDLSWWESSQCVFVGDMKYKALGGKSGHNSDLYQMLAYTLAAGLDMGLLIYASGEAEPRTHYVPSVSKSLRVVTLDVAGQPDEVLANVGRLAARIRRIRSRVAVAVAS